MLHNNRPPVAADTNPHRPRPASWPPAACDAAAIAANASPTSDPDGSRRVNDGASHNAQRMKCARIRSARAANRDNQARTVERGTPNAAAICRCPCPTAHAASALPITAAKSPRRSNTVAGSSTCVA